MKRNYIYTVLAALLLALVAFLFFLPDDVEGNVLQQHDIMQGLANGQEGVAFHEATGESTRWTNSLFGGMPNFQIAPSYPANNLLDWIGKTYMLWLPSPANLLFGMMLGFFIMCLCLKMKWHTALFASLAWGFSSYFIIIIGAGHIWKFLTLCYIPPTIGGIALIYRGKYLPGAALTSLFGALQLQSNHPQMTYYFLFVVLAMVLAWLYTAVKSGAVAQWGKATGLTVLAGLCAVAANSASLYNSLQYSKETVRGKATEIIADNHDDTGGMNRDAITAWSYGPSETFSLLIPNVKGGATIKPVAGENSFLSVGEVEKADEVYLSPEERQFVQQFPQYFGNQPMTNGPVYVGAFVLMLAILALFTVQTPMKWALFAVSIFSILLSWGHNLPAVTNFFIDYFPGYNKFRAVASILVIVEFTIPLLAALCVKKMTDEPKTFTDNKWTFITVFGLGAFICFLGWVAPSVFGSAFSDQEIMQLSRLGVFTAPEYANLWKAITEIRYSMVSADALRSLIFILLGALVCWIYLKGALKSKPLFVCSLATLVVLDLFAVGKRYVDSDNFTAPVENSAANFRMTDADRAILRDTSYYRVMDIDHFGEARSSYFHKTIGGYHAAKLTRYNDLIEHQISKNNLNVLNMLNTKYFLKDDTYFENPDALGNAWWVSSIDYVAGPNEEMSALDSLDTAHKAVADKKFESVIGKASPVAPGDTISLTSYAPNRLTYDAKSAKGGVAVFSDIYFPWGWKATVDGNPVEIGRVNYVLRALHLPAGNHKVVFTFDPDSLKTTNAISIAAVIIIYLLCLGAIAFRAVPKLRTKGREKE